MPTVFLSAATVDLEHWRRKLRAVLAAAQFDVREQSETLGVAGKDVRDLLIKNIDESDCVLHFAGLGYGDDAHTPFPSHPKFVCSWTQFEYYYAHSIMVETGKDVFAFVCAPAMSRSNWEVDEAGDDAERARKRLLQRDHRSRVESGRFEGTPLAGLSRRFNNYAVVNDEIAIWKFVASAIKQVQRDWGDHKGRVLRLIDQQVESLKRIEEKVDGANEKLDALLQGQKASLSLSLIPPWFTSQQLEDVRLQKLNIRTEATITEVTSTCHFKATKKTIETRFRINGKEHRIRRSFQLGFRSFLMPFLTLVLELDGAILQSREIPFFSFDTFDQVFLVDGLICSAKYTFTFGWVSKEIWLGNIRIA